ncbi:hypothetical protein V6N13_033470 [Hibiscus sabdariffa]
MGTDDQLQASSRPLLSAILVSSFLRLLLLIHLEIIATPIYVYLRICGVEYGLGYMLTIGLLVIDLMGDDWL